jgi:group I intron endonuclease
MRKGYIYKLICPISGECRYVGKTVQTLNKRLYKHKYNKRKNPSHKNSWLIQLENKGLLNEMKIELIGEYDISVLNNKEIFWIAKLKGYKLTNMTEGGDVGSLGHKHSDEAIKKISEAGKRRKGYKHTDEAKKNISKSLIGNDRHKGCNHSVETKKQISKTKKGTVSWNAQTVSQLDKEDNIINEWRSASDAAKNLGLSQGNIWSVINGDRNTCGGFKWKLK